MKKIQTEENRVVKTLNKYDYIYIHQGLKNNDS